LSLLVKNVIPFLLQFIFEPLRKPRSKWEDNIRMNVREIGWEIEVWMHLAQGREQRQAIVNTVMNLQFP